MREGGVLCLAPRLSRFGQLSEYERAELKRKKKKNMGSGQERGRAALWLDQTRLRPVLTRRLSSGPGGGEDGGWGWAGWLAGWSLGERARRHRGNKKKRTPKKERQNEPARYFLADIHRVLTSVYGGGLEPSLVSAHYYGLGAGVGRRWQALAGAGWRWQA